MSLQQRTHLIIDHRKKQESAQPLTATLDLEAQDYQIEFLEFYYDQFSTIRAKMNANYRKDCMEGIYSTLKATPANVRISFLFV